MAISSDDTAGCAAMQSEVGNGVLVLSDPGASATAHLGLLDYGDTERRTIARPSIFIVDAEGIVRYRYVGRSVDDRPKTELLILAAESLATLSLR